VHGGGVELQLRSHLLQNAPRVRACSVALVHEAQPRDAVAAHLAVDGDRLRLDAAHGAEHQDGAVQNP